MSDPSHDSWLDPDTTRQILRFVSGKIDEINKFGRRSWSRMVAMARTLLRRHHVSQAEYSDEDAANSALFKLCELAEAGQLESIATRDGFWKRYGSVLERKVLLARRRQQRKKRGGAGLGRDRLGGATMAAPAERPAPLPETLINVGDHPGPPRARIAIRSLFDTLNQELPTIPPAERAVLFQEELQKLLDRLHDPVLQDILTQRINGHTVTEIARRLNCTSRNIRRKIARIRLVLIDCEFGQ